MDERLIEQAAGGDVNAWILTVASIVLLASISATVYAFRESQSEAQAARKEIIEIFRQQQRRDDENLKVTTAAMKDVSETVHQALLAIAAIESKVSGPLRDELRPLLDKMATIETHVHDLLKFLSRES